MPEWDEKNRPINYILSVTPGFARLAEGPERLTYMGLARKITRASRMGFEFAEIDFEALSEMHEPDIQRQVQHIKDVQKMEIGLHLAVDMDLCLAHAYQWKYMHEMLRKGAIAGEMTKTKFILFHTSSMARPAITASIGERTGPAKLVAWNGVNLGNFIDNENMRDWFMAKFMEVMFRAMGSAGDVDVITYFDRIARSGKGFRYAEQEAERRYNEIRKSATVPITQRQLAELRQIESDLINRINNTQDPRARETLEANLRGRRQQIQRLEMVGAEITDENHEEFLGNIRKMGLYREFRQVSSVYGVVRRTDFNNVFDYWKIHGSEAEEYVAYHVVAKWMQKKKDGFWTSIVGDKRDPDQIIYEADLESGKKRELTETVKEIITAVAAKYIEGHLKTKLQEYEIKTTDNRIMSVFDFCKANKIHIFIETNMPGGYEGGRGAPPGELRIIKATDHVKIAKVLGGDDVSYCMDFEHLLTNYIDPEKEADALMRSGDGKYVRCLHLNAPRPIVGAHGPIELFSNDMYILYRFIYKMRKAGMNNAYFIWEMGGYGVGMSAIAFRNIKAALLKNIEPKDLPPEFFGIRKDFEAQQMTAIREHAFDPIQGLMLIPEERHTFLSRSALEKGKAREWERERYR